MAIPDEIKVTEMPVATQDNGLLMVSQGEESALESKNIHVNFDNGPEYYDLSSSTFVNIPATFSRASDAYAWDGTKFKKYGPNEPRFEVGVDGKPKGLLIEGQSTSYGYGTFAETSRLSVDDNFPSIIEGHTAKKLTNTSTSKYGNTTIGQVADVENKIVSTKFIIERVNSDNVRILFYRPAPTPKFNHSSVIQFSGNFINATTNSDEVEITKLSDSGPNGGVVLLVNIVAEIPSDMTGIVKILLYPHYIEGAPNNGVYLHHSQAEITDHSSSLIIPNGTSPTIRAADNLSLDVFSKLLNTGFTVQVKLNDISPDNLKTNAPKILLGTKKHGDSADTGSIGYTGKTTNNFECRAKGVAPETTDQYVTLGDHADITFSGNLAFGANQAKAVFSLDGKDPVTITGSMGDMYTHFNELYFDGRLNGYVESVTVLPELLSDNKLKRMSR